MSARHAVLAGLLFLAAGCADGSGPTPLITVWPAVPGVMTLGDTLALAARVEGDPGAGVAWTSSAPAVASVTREGVVRAVRAGSAILEAASLGVRRRFHVEVFGELVIETEPQGSFPAFLGDVFRVRARMRGGPTLGSMPMAWSQAGMDAVELWPDVLCDPLGCREQASAVVRLARPGRAGILFRYGAATASLPLDVVAPPAGVSAAVLLPERFVVNRVHEGGWYGYYPWLRVREAAGLSEAVVTEVEFQMEGVAFGHLPPWTISKRIPAGGAAELISVDAYGEWETTWGSEPPSDTVLAIIRYRDKAGRVGDLLVRTGITAVP